MTIDFIDGDHVVLMAVGVLRDVEAISRRLMTLMTAGVCHISINVRFVTDIQLPVVDCLDHVAFCLSGYGGTLEIIDALPSVSAAFSDLGVTRPVERSRRRYDRTGAAVTGTVVNGPEGSAAMFPPGEGSATMGG
ncbi:MAG: hypothetical protein ABIQ39_09030 [Ilumatobacteraceae bacterium]